MPRWWMALFFAVSATGLGTQLHLSASDAQEPHGSLQQQIAQVEQQVDSIEADAVAMIASLPLGGAHKPATLGKALFFDKNLSVNRNEACAFCHMPQTGFQGALAGGRITP
jgi:cytochrome c peroxidase